jgi:hypothetical protein
MESKFEIRSTYSTMKYFAVRLASPHPKIQKKKPVPNATPMLKAAQPIAEPAEHTPSKIPPSLKPRNPRAEKQKFEKPCAQMGLLAVFVFVKL